METISNFSELRKYGVDLLTGESCALSRRLLCDVTEKGKVLVCKALGVPDISLPRSWNGGEAVGSVLLDRETLQTICILALFENEKAVEVWDDGGRFSSLDAETLKLYEGSDFSHCSTKRYRIPNRSARNQHQMSGRIN